MLLISIKQVINHPGKTDQLVKRFSRAAKGDSRAYGYPQEPINILDVIDSEHLEITDILKLIDMFANKWDIVRLATLLIGYSVAHINSFDPSQLMADIGKWLKDPSGKLARHIWGRQVFNQNNVLHDRYARPLRDLTGLMGNHAYPNETLDAHHAGLGALLYKNNELIVRDHGHDTFNMDRGYIKLIKSAIIIQFTD